MRKQPKQKDQSYYMSHTNELFFDSLLFLLSCIHAISTFLSALSLYDIIVDVHYSPRHLSPLPFLQPS
jgi:hypothetical protein